ncbi:hypothetical protein CANCADRAFT_29494 [Tortispora caseinolytica NRRL Y-17796]|uniref:TauD/TfdA-like domain-containing protein n=1 Tax=Tortispora caseinolytica NRRL Y-17796 TaxID=767744 RepID=A0A1E4TBF6_9ASCO|nr:hypothetical protein CANCADRAFT_29494 [Tortispora caseinolytica NRRL Y-17796]
MKRFRSRILPRLTQSPLTARRYVSSILERRLRQLDPLFLRDACNCHECVMPDTKQKTFSTAELPENTRIQSLHAEEDGYNVTWNSGHVSKYSFSFINRYSSLRSIRESRLLDSNDGDWATMPQESISLSFNDYMSNDETLLQALTSLNKYGLVFLTDGPAQEKLNGDIAVEAIARRVGYIKETFYGRSWDVRSVPDARNIAYTNVYLPLHMDLLYYESPPGLQYLHCIANDATGGESLFADSFAAAKHVRSVDPEGYKVLCNFPVTFHYVNDGHHYHCTRPFIVEDPYGVDKDGLPPIKHINYSPPFQGPFEYNINSSSDPLNIKKFHNALRLFEEYINDPANQLERKMSAGETVIFFNRRSLHARRLFDLKTGSRWLKGTYSDIDTFYSKFRVLSTELKKQK